MVGKIEILALAGAGALLWLTTQDKRGAVENYGATQNPNAFSPPTNPTQEQQKLIAAATSGKAANYNGQTIGWAEAAQAVDTGYWFQGTHYNANTGPLYPKAAPYPIATAADLPGVVLPVGMNWAQNYYVLPNGQITPVV